MFSTPKVKAFIQGASLQGNADEQFVQFMIYITPITHVLACQVSPVIGDRLFKFDAAKKPHPISEMDGPKFDIGTIDLQLMTLHPSADPKMDKHGVLLKAVQISKISARKLYPDNPNFSLIFSAELPKDDLSFSMMGRYFKREVYLSFETMQKELPLASVPNCEYCDNPSVAQDSEETFLCERDLKSKAVGEVRFIAKKESPKEAEARVKANAGIKDIPGDDKKDTSHINRQRGGKN